ncbi:GxxExxY protein [Deferrisoma camini]|uniref:GxxExxY protein n=1 Tax=Deferrisoma camini TaxID=1035120 RepID=UPI00046CBAB9|nr:GxxExxY protein [Deferrisoma camini]
MGIEDVSPELNRLTEAVIGAAIEVHRHLGPGYLESVYEEALGIELDLRGIPHQRQVPVSVDYKGRSVGEGRLDLLVGDRLVVELKAVEALAPIHHAQVISYLKATGSPVGLLLNFNVPSMKEGIRRVVLTEKIQMFSAPSAPPRFKRF